MDPKVLAYLSDTSNMNEQERLTNDALIRLYLTGMVQADWNNGSPLFHITLSGEEEYMLAYANSVGVSPISN